MTKEQKKKALVGLSIAGGVGLLIITYRQGFVKGMAKGAYLAGYSLGRTIKGACDNGTLAPGTDQKILEILKIGA